MPQENGPDWEEYEAITQYIYGALGEKDEIKVITIFSELKSRGKLPETATIDVPTGGKLYWRLPGNDITVEK